MALIACPECGVRISDKAAACPHCGNPTASRPVDVAAPQERPVHVQVVKKKSNTIWWVIGTPVVLAAAFLGYGASIPANEANARSIRRVCETMMAEGRTTQYECDQAFDKAWNEGKKAAYVPSPPVPGVTQADIDAALADGALKSFEPRKPQAYPKVDLYGTGK
jgi:hypothetical protein